MGKRLGARAAILAGAGAVFSAGLVEATEPTLVLHVDCVVDSMADISRAEAEVDRIFQAAGVRIVWIVGPVSTRVSSALPFGGTRHLALIIANGHRRKVKTSTSSLDAVLGEADHQLGRAHVFADRVVAATNARTADRNIVLGRVMAHEIGHLVLPPNSHSKFGIMQAGIEFTMAGVHVFTDSQAASIRGALLGGADYQDAKHQRLKDPTSSQRIAGTLVVGDVDPRTLRAALGGPHNRSVTTVCAIREITPHQSRGVNLFGGPPRTLSPMSAIYEMPSSIRRVCQPSRPGSRLVPCEIVALPDMGGMGEVSRDVSRDVWSVNRCWRVRFLFVHHQRTAPLSSRFVNHA